MPVSGSIGVAETAMFVGHQIVCVALSATLAAALLLFRFLTFWPPLLPGGLALRALRRSGRL